MLLLRILCEKQVLFLLACSCDTLMHSSHTHEGGRNQEHGHECEHEHEPGSTAQKMTAMKVRNDDEKEDTMK